ncbi:38811_t:CDS:1, partial [Gigaspora margarita]
MVFPLDHQDVSLRGQPKGLRVVLSERGLWREGLLKKCKNGCELGATNCCAVTIMSNEPDFLEQKCQLEEIITSRGHK